MASTDVYSIATWLEKQNLGKEIMYEEGVDIRHLLVHGW